MKSNALKVLAVAATLTAAGAALAQTPSQYLWGDGMMFENLERDYGRASPGGKTREQVQAELREAIRTGDMYVGGESSRKAYEVTPWLYPPQPVAAGPTREQVQSELREALRAGTILSGDSVPLQGLAPLRHPAATLTADGKRARDEVAPN